MELQQKESEIKRKDYELQAIKYGKTSDKVGITLCSVVGLWVIGVFCNFHH